MQSEDKERYNTMKCFTIPKDAVKTSWFSSFIADLVEPQVFPILKKQKALSEFIPDRKYDENFLYKDVFREVFAVGGGEIEASTLESILGPGFNHELSMQQRGGICAEQSLHEIIKHSIPNRKNANLILFALKLHSIESFLDKKLIKIKSIPRLFHN